MKKVLKTGLAVLIVGLAIFVAAQFLLPLVLVRFVRTEASYVEYPVKTMMSEADVIFLGQVVNIGETRWNQENGRYWNGGLPYHDITLSLAQPIVGDMNEEVKLTVIGNSPLDGSEDTLLASDHALAMGDEVIVFARNTEFAWRRPERIPAIMFMGSPQTSILTKEEDGLYHSINGDVYSLEDFIAEVGEQKTQLDR